MGISIGTGAGTSHVTSSFGVLWNHYTQIANDARNTGSLNPMVTGFRNDSSSKLRLGPLYSRRHGLYQSSSLTSPTGRTELRRSNNLNNDTLFGGEAAWDVPRQSGKYPFYDSYPEYSDEMRRKAKDYTIVPEFRMSEHVPRFLSSSAQNTPDNIFEITGSKQGTTDSSFQDFYTIYSNSDFLKILILSWKITKTSQILQELL